MKTMITDKKYSIVPSGSLVQKAYIGLKDVAFQCGIHPELLDRFVKIGLVDTVGIG